MFNLFKPKIRFKSPYTFPNDKKEYYGKNILDLRIKLERVLDNSENIFTITFIKQRISTHEYFTDFNGELITDIENILKHIYSIANELDKKNKINKKDTTTIERNSRIQSITESVRRTLDYLIDK